MIELSSFSMLYIFLYVEKINKFSNANGSKQRISKFILIDVEVVNMKVDLKIIQCETTSHVEDG